MKLRQGPALITPGTRWLAVLVLAAHVFFFVSALVHRSYLTDDSIQYLTLAENWVQTSIFSQSFFDAQTPDLQRTPGYPAFLILCGQMPWLVLAVQHLLILGAGWMLFRALSLIGSVRMARFGAWFWLLQPYPIVMSSLVLSESLFLFFLAWGMWKYLAWRQEGGFQALAWGLLGLGLGVLVRPVGLAVLAVVLVDGMWWALRRRSIRSAAALAVIPVLVLGPWMLRHHQIAGKASLSSMGNLGMLHGRLGGVVALERGDPLEDHSFFMNGDSVAAQAVGWASVRTYAGTEQIQETEILPSNSTSIALGYLGQHPAQTAKLVGKSLFQMLKGVGYGWTQQVTQSKNMGWVIAILQLLFNLVLYLGFAWSFLSIRRWKSLDYFFLLQIIALYALSAAIWADGRYRIPIDFEKMLKIISKTRGDGISLKGEKEKKRWKRQQQQDRK